MCMYIHMCSYTFDTSHCCGGREKQGETVHEERDGYREELIGNDAVRNGDLPAETRRRIIERGRGREQRAYNLQFIEKDAL